MKIVFFDVDERTKNYIKGRKVCDCSITMYKNGLADLTPKQYEEIKDADVISIFVVAVNKLDEAALSKFPNLKLIATRSTGFDHIDIEYCKDNGIEVVNVPKYGEATVAEYTFGLLLNVSRKIIATRNDMLNGRYNVDDYIGLDLYGRTLGVIGTGSIGRHVGKIAKGFGMEVIAYDLYPNEEFARLYNINYVSLDELYAKADVISLHAPSTKENKHLLSTQAFSKMKDGVIIVNTARGDLIDGEALYKALVAGKVGGAGLDVFENEDFLIHDDIILKQEDKQMTYAMDTVINVKLMQHPHVVATPHMAFNSLDALHRILDTTLNNITAFEAGKTQNSVIKK